MSQNEHHIDHSHEHDSSGSNIRRSHAVSNSNEGNDGVKKRARITRRKSLCTCNLATTTCSVHKHSLAIVEKRTSDDANQHFRNSSFPDASSNGTLLPIYRRRSQYDGLTSPQLSTVPLPNRNVMPLDRVTPPLDIRYPIWLRPPRHLPEDNSPPMSRTITSFVKLARSRLHKGWSHARILGAGPMDITKLYANTGYVAYNDPVSVPSLALNLACAAFPDASFMIKIVFANQIMQVLRWMIYPTEQNYERLGPWGRPTHTQLTVPHLPEIDIFSLPVLRDLFITKAPDPNYNTVPHFHCTWPLDVPFTTVDPKTKTVILTAEFEAFASSEISIAGDAVALNFFPQLKGVIREVPVPPLLYPNLDVAKPAIPKDESISEPTSWSTEQSNINTPLETGPSSATSYPLTSSPRPVESDSMPRHATSLQSMQNGKAPSSDGRETPLTMPSFSTRSSDEILQAVKIWSAS